MEPTMDTAKVAKTLRLARPWALGGAITILLLEHHIFLLETIPK